MGALLCRIVTQLNATHEKRLPLEGQVLKHQSLLRRKGSSAKCRIFWGVGEVLSEISPPLRKALFACWLRAGMYL